MLGSIRKVCIFVSTKKATQLNKLKLKMIYLFNTNIVPGECVCRVSKISAEKARNIVCTADSITSAIGHDATAAAMSEILQLQVSANRIQAEPKHGDKAVSLKLNGRLPEGMVLDRDQLEEIGYSLYLMEFYESSFVIAPYAEFHSVAEYL